MFSKSFRFKTLIIYCIMSKIFTKLPIEIINKIINYTNVIVYRHGKYINRIKKDDKRYLKIFTIPRPIKMTNNKYSIYLLDKKSVEWKGYTMTYYMKNNNVTKYYLIINFIIRKNDAYDHYYECKNTENYIFDSNSNWSKIVSYLM